MFFLFELIVILFVSIVLSLEDYLTAYINVILIFTGFIILFLLRIINFSFLRAVLFLFQGGLCMSFYIAIYFLSDKKLGPGDILFGFFSGFSILRWDFLWLSTVLSYAFFEIFYSVCKLKKINLQNKRIPFIPFMSAGLIVTYILSYSL